MKNTYFTGYFPLISIIMFSLSYAIYVEAETLELLKSIGLYVGLLEFFSTTEIKITLLFVIFLLFFMMFSALKLISDTIMEISLLFFSKDMDGNIRKSTRLGSVIYFIGGGISILCTMSILLITLVFFITTMVAFMYFIYKASSYLTSIGLVGFVFFQIFIWGCILVAVGYSVLKLYNSLLASLPI